MSTMSAYDWTQRTANGRHTATAHALLPGRIALCGTSMTGHSLIAAHEYATRCKSCVKLAAQLDNRTATRKEQNMSKPQTLKSFTLLDTDGRMLATADAATIADADAQLIERGFEIIDYLDDERLVGRELTPQRPFAIGQRVESTTRDEAGKVVGYVRDSIKIAWDGGGTSSSPVSHGGLRVERKPELDPELRDDPSPMSDEQIVERFGADALEPAQTTNEHSIVDELGVTQRVDRGDVQLVVHRVTCRLKSARTPLALVSSQQRWNEAKPCSTCQPSARQMRELQTYIVDRRATEHSNASHELQSMLEPCVDDATLAADAAERDELEQQELRERRQRAHAARQTGMSEQQIALLQRRAQRAQDAASEIRESAARVSELDAALIALGVDPHAPAADVVPLTKRGKRNDKSRTRRHEQRDVQPREQSDESSQTRVCVDCHETIKLTAFPTSTLKGQRVRLDYCRKCRTVRATAKASKS